MDATVFITGAAQRVGRAIALHLAQAGWDVAIHYHRSAADAAHLQHAIAAMGRRACLIQADLSQDFDAAALFAAASHLPPVRCLINSAALFERDTLAHLDADSFTRQMQVNVLAPLKLIAAFAAIAPSGSSIINLGDSTKGWSLSSQFLSYALSKYSVMQLAELLALELAPRLRINTVALGPTLPGVADGDDTFARLAARAPLGIHSSPDEVCAAVDFLLAAPSVTGQTIQLSGGFHLHRPLDLTTAPA